MQRPQDQSMWVTSNEQRVDILCWWTHGETSRREVRGCPCTLVLCPRGPLKELALMLWGRQKISGELGAQDWHHSDIAFKKEHWLPYGVWTQRGKGKIRDNRMLLRCSSRKWRRPGLDLELFRMCSHGPFLVDLIVQCELKFMDAKRVSDTQRGIHLH